MRKNAEQIIDGQNHASLCIEGHCWVAKQQITALMKAMPYFRKKGNTGFFLKNQCRILKKRVIQA